MSAPKKKKGGHASRCCDPKKRRKALSSTNAGLPGIEGKTAHKSNRFINPNSKKKGEAKTFFPVKKGTDIPVLDGLGNYLGQLSPASVEKGVRINWGQTKVMPRFDPKRIEANPADRFAKPDEPPRQHVYVFSAAMVTPRDWIPKDDPKFSKMRGRATPISGWIPKSALAPSAKRNKLFDCANGCMAAIEQRRRKSGRKQKLRFLDLHEVRWTSREWWSQGPPSGKGQEISERMTHEAIQALVEKKRVHKKMFPNASISGAKAGEGNMAARDYLARSPALPSAYRCVNFLWAVPGSGGVSTDSFPVGTTFHRLVAYKKQTRIYRNGKATSKKITWYYGYVEYPEGKGKGTGRRYGWVLKNAVGK